jgi:hypothetical protein
MQPLCKLPAYPRRPHSSPPLHPASPLLQAREGHALPKPGRAALIQTFLRRVSNLRPTRATPRAAPRATPRPAETARGERQQRNHCFAEGAPATLRVRARPFRSGWLWPPPAQQGEGPSAGVLAPARVPRGLVTRHPHAHAAWPPWPPARAPLQASGLAPSLAPPQPLPLAPCPVPLAPCPPRPAPQLLLQPQDPGDRRGAAGQPPLPGQPDQHGVEDGQGEGATARGSGAAAAAAAAAAGAAGAAAAGAAAAEGPVALRRATAPYRRNRRPRPLFAAAAGPLPCSVAGPATGNI